jgi:hypothetical protein
MATTAPFCRGAARCAGSVRRNRAWLHGHRATYNGPPHVSRAEWTTYVRNEQPDEPGEHRRIS